MLKKYGSSRGEKATFRLFHVAFYSLLLPRASMFVIQSAGWSKFITLPREISENSRDSFVKRLPGIKESHTHLILLSIVNWMTSFLPHYCSRASDITSVLFSYYYPCFIYEKDFYFIYEYALTHNVNNDFVIVNFPLVR